MTHQHHGRSMTAQPTATALRNSIRRPPSLTLGVQSASAMMCGSGATPPHDAAQQDTHDTHGGAALLSPPSVADGGGGGRTAALSSARRLPPPLKQVAAEGNKEEGRSTDP